MDKETKRGISMISAATEALKHRHASREIAMHEVGRFVGSEKDEVTKLGMIAAASKALEVAERNTFLTDRQIITQIMGQLGEIMQGISAE